jgi:hypothetical protein
LAADAGGASRRSVDAISKRGYSAFASSAVFRRLDASADAHPARGGRERTANTSDPMNRTVKATEAEFWSAFGGFCPPGGFFHFRGEAQVAVGRRLVEAIDALLVPRLGASQESKTWRHELDAYREGIHSLLFTASSFDPDIVPLLQGLLVGEHEVFCILCQVLPSLESPSTARIGSVAIRSNRLLVSYPLVKFSNGRL